MSDQAGAAKVLEQGAQGGVLVKLIIFSFSLAVLPLSSYFASEKYLWGGNSTYAALTAVGAANVVLVAFIVFSILEDSKQETGPVQPQKMSEKLDETRKDR